MKRARYATLLRLGLVVVIALAWGVLPGFGQNGNANGKKLTRDEVYVKKFKKIAPSVRKEAAKQARLRGVKPGKAGTGLAAAALLPGIEGPGGIPHYFGPYGNWAFSPLPKGPLNAALTVDAGGSGYTTSPIVTITDAYDGTITETLPGTATLSLTGGVITGITVSPTRVYTAPVVTITDLTGTGALATATFNMATVTGGLPKFVDRLPGLGPAGANNVIQAHGEGQYIPVGVAEPCTHSGQAADCYSIALVEYSEKLSSNLPATKLRGYVQLETPVLLNWMTTQVPPLSSKHVSVPGGKFAIDNPHYLGPTIVAQGRAVGVASLAGGDPKPVRITFYNLLPTGAGGHLFLPVDESVPGAGVGPSTPVSKPGEKYTENRATIHLHGNNTVWISDGNTHQWITPAATGVPNDTAYPAGVSARNVPDMGPGCDAVAGTGLPGDPATKKSSGCMTFFYTNAQSARLQFYHDHAHGITRLNVYAGEAAGYLLTDAVEQDLIKGSNNSGVNILPDGGTCTLGALNGCAKVLPGLGIPLIIQDKTFVDANTVFAQDPTWNSGTGPRDVTTGNITGAVSGDLWYPHVYMPVTNPWDLTGTNAFGRWFYGPWFNPPTPTCVNGRPVGCIAIGPVPNEYAGAAPWEPPMRPGVPNPSIPGESFMDTSLVNGNAYPYVEVPAGPVRFRVLNANNDRALNLQLYKAADKTTWVAGTGAANPGSPTTVCAPGATIANCTEVRMVPVSVAPANQYADTLSGIPDPTTAGPQWIQIGTEGGFMPAPVVVPQKPIGFNPNVGQFNVGIVNQHSLYLMPAERADVIVDFSSAAVGQTFILYNDAPAPVPAGAAVYDFYTGDGDQTGSGGPPNTLPGYGPNTRTIMQIRVTGAAAGAPNYSLTNLQAVFAKGPNGKRGVFEVSQDPIIIPQDAYKTAYNPPAGTPQFPTDASQYILNVGDKQKTFQPLGYTAPVNGTPATWKLQPPVTFPLEMKAMHDEMGGVYDTEFGRMSGMLGLTNPNSAQGFILPFPFSSPPTDVVKGSFEATPIGTPLADGTQLWRIFHNGVDTHPIHTHLFTAQVINRVGQDGQVAQDTLPVAPGDVGWKDTFKVNPLEITFLALRPTVPSVSQVPFEVPNSIRLIDPILPFGATLPPPGPAGWFNPNGNPIAQITNHIVNFGWEYVWHCHILSHEEMDFMHALVFAAPPRAPNGLTALWNGNANQPRVTLTWTDNSSQEVGFTVQRASDANFTIGLTTLATVPASPGPLPGTPPVTVTYTDTNPAKNSTYHYRVWAKGEVVGDTSMAAFPTMSADSVSNTAPASTFLTTTAPAAPTNLTATAQTGPRVSLAWRDNANNESGFYVQRCSFVTGAAPCTGFTQIAALGPGNNTVTYIDTTVTGGNSYLYQVAAFNADGSPASTSAWATLATPADIPAIPPAVVAGTFTVTAAPGNGNNATATLAWPGYPVNPTSFTIQRATNLTFTTGLTSFTAVGTSTGLTQTVNRITTYYYRIRANNSLGGSSAWTNALPFPIRTP